jgi:hypothetical protein
MEHGKIYVDVNMGMSTWVCQHGFSTWEKSMSTPTWETLCLPTWETQHGYVPFLFLFLFGKRVP